MGIGFRSRYQGFTPEEVTRAYRSLRPERPYNKSWTDYSKVQLWSKRVCESCGEEKDLDKFDHYELSCEQCIKAYYLEKNTDDWWL